VLQRIRLAKMPTFQEGIVQKRLAIVSITILYIPLSFITPNLAVKRAHSLCVKTDEVRGSGSAFTEAANFDLPLIMLQ